MSNDNKDNKMNKRFIRSMWSELNVANVFTRLMGAPASLNGKSMECLKDSYKSSIWKIEVRAGNSSLPVILKVSKALEEARPESIVENKIYTRAAKMLQPFMPKIYCTKRNVNGRDLWVFMEYIQPIQGRVKYGPDYFEKIIPSLAELHAATLGIKFKQQKDLFAGWFPRFDSPAKLRERVRQNRLTQSYLDEAMKSSEFRPLLQPHYNTLKKWLQRGPGYFPEVSQAGLSIVHGDLHTANIACHDIHAPHWQVKFIDWEGASYAPCWYDLVYLVGIYLAYKKEWRRNEEDITRRAVQLYADEMEKRGVRFKGDPLTLYKKAYMKRLLEKGLFLQLSWAVSGVKQPKLLHVYLEKINTWGKELGLE